MAFDKTGKYIITGSDDARLKIWSVATGMLLAVCRGHRNEISDIKVSADNSMVASASMDGTIRVWSLKGTVPFAPDVNNISNVNADGEDRGEQGGDASQGRNNEQQQQQQQQRSVWRLNQLGAPVSVLQGHQAFVSYLEFCPTVPSILLSSSADGTCRIWDARDATVPPRVLRVDNALRFGLGGTALTRHLGHGGLLLDLEGVNLGTRRRTTRQQQQQNGGGGGVSSVHQQQQPVRRNSRPSRHNTTNENVFDLTQGSDDVFIVDDNNNDSNGGAQLDDGLTAQQQQGGEGGEAGGIGADPALAEAETACPAGPTLLVCAFSPDGCHIVSGSDDCNGYVWYWPLAATLSGQQQQQQQQTKVVVDTEVAGGRCGGGDKGKEPAVDGGEQQQQQEEEEEDEEKKRHPPFERIYWGKQLIDLPHTKWPDISELCRLQGHRNNVILLQFSHNGTRIATGSKDGTVRIWKQPRKYKKKQAHWDQELCLACLPDEEAIKLARQRRRPIPAPCIDQISWSCDDQKLLVSVTDYTIRVFSMPSGKLQTSLNAHTDRIHILECHPTDPRLAISASYDGEVHIWDIEQGGQGKKLKTFTSRATRPDGRTWPDTLFLTDGHFSPDGDRFVVSDVAGQFHLYGIGTQCPLACRAPYDQFLTSETNQLVIDVRGNVLDADTDLPAFLLSGREALADGNLIPYSEAFQRAFGTRRLLEAPVADVVSDIAGWGSPAMRNNGATGRIPTYISEPPTIQSALWHALENGLGEHGQEMAIRRAMDRLQSHEAMQDAGIVSPQRRQQEQQARQAAAAAAGGGGGGNNNNNRRGGGLGAADRAAARRRREEAAERGDSPFAEPASSGEQFEPGPVYDDDDDEDEFDSLNNRRWDDGFIDDDQADEDDDGNGFGGGGRRSRRITERRRTTTAAAANGRRRRRRSGLDEGAMRAMQRQERLQRAARRQEGGLVEREGRRQSVRARRRRRGDEDYVSNADEEEEEDIVMIDDRHTTSEEEEYNSELEMNDEEDEDDHKGDEGEEVGGGVRASQRRAAKQAKRALKRSISQQERTPKRRRTAVGNRSRSGHPSSSRHGHDTQCHVSGSKAAQQGARKMEDYSWLTATSRQPGSYIPQAGDQVVYLLQGHKKYLSDTNDKMPSMELSLANIGTVRPAEPAVVEEIEYTISDTGFDYTLAKLKLKLTDPLSPLYNSYYEVEVPPPFAGHTEFIILKHRFEAGVLAGMHIGCVCKSIWYTDDVAEWWVGDVTEDAADGALIRMTLEQAYNSAAADQLWEQFKVAWRGAADTLRGEVFQPVVLPRPGGEEGVEITACSPWELYLITNDNSSSSNSSQVEAAELSMTTVPVPLLEALQQALELATNEPRWGVFISAPEPDEKYRSKFNRIDYYNRLVPVPLSMAEIQERVLLGYYRQVDAIIHDIKTIAGNAVLFHGSQGGAGAEVTRNAEALAAYLNAVVSSGGGGALSSGQPQQQQQQQQQQAEEEEEGQPGPSNPIVNDQHLTTTGVGSIIVVPKPSDFPTAPPPDTTTGGGLRVKLHLPRQEVVQYDEEEEEEEGAGEEAGGEEEEDVDEYQVDDVEDGTEEEDEEEEEQEQEEDKGISAAERVKQRRNRRREQQQQREEEELQALRERYPQQRQSTRQRRNTVYKYDDDDDDDDE